MVIFLVCVLPQEEKREYGKLVVLSKVTSLSRVNTLQPPSACKTLMYVPVNSITPLPFGLISNETASDCKIQLPAVG